MTTIKEQEIMTKKNIKDKDNNKGGQQQQQENDYRL